MGRSFKPGPGAIITVSSDYRMMQATVAWSADAVIRADCPWNDTGITLDAGGLYDFVAEGKWVDLLIPSGPGGNADPTWTQRLFASRLRARDENYFALIGALDRDPSNMFCIGEARRLQAHKTGHLTCFANDVPGFYWNNRGSVRLTVTRIG